MVAIENTNTKWKIPNLLYQRMYILHGINHENEQRLYHKYLDTFTQNIHPFTFKYNRMSFNGTLSCVDPDQTTHSDAYVMPINLI